MARRVRFRREMFGDEGAVDELGRMRKHRACGCDRARCGVCHPSKRWYRQADRARDEQAWRRDVELA